MIRTIRFLHRQRRPEGRHPHLMEVAAIRSLKRWGSLRGLNGGWWTTSLIYSRTFLALGSLFKRHPHRLNYSNPIHTFRIFIFVLVCCPLARHQRIMFVWTNFSSNPST